MIDEDKGQKKKETTIDNIDKRQTKRKKLRIYNAYAYHLKKTVQKITNA